MKQAYVFNLLLLLKFFFYEKPNWLLIELEFLTNKL